MDWANLPEGPAGLIAELALAGDVADYIRFRAVCGPWRRCSADPRAAGLDGRFLPRRWIMLDNAFSGPRRHRFLNVSTGECIRMDLDPELAEHALTPEGLGLLLLLHAPTLVVRLLNPLTRQLTDFPPVTALLPPEQLLLLHSGHDTPGEIPEVEVEGSGAGIVADSSPMLVVEFCYPRVLAVAKPGGDRWAVVDVDGGYICSTLAFAGRFYCSSGRGVMVLDTDSDQQQPPRLRVVVERSCSLLRYNAMSHRKLMLVHRMLYIGADNRYKRKCEAYRVSRSPYLITLIKMGC